MSDNLNKDNANTYILYQPHSFFDYTLEPLLADPNYHMRHHRRKKSLMSTIKRQIRFLLPGKHPGLWSRDILGDEYVDFLKDIRPCDKLIFWAVGNRKDIKIISEDVAASRISSMLLDPMRQVCHRSQKQMREYAGFMHKLGVRACTFDTDDARQYGLDYVGQMYRYPKPSETIENQTPTVLFIGVDKRRARQLDNIAARLEEEGIDYTFRIVFDKHSTPGRYPRLDACRMAKIIPYDEVLRETYTANCLLDVLQPNQSGLTMRVLEALFFGKKLITDNLTVKAEPFYRPENIYVIDDPDQPWPTIRDFLATPVSIVSPEIIKQYDIREWIKKL